LNIHVKDSTSLIIHSLFLILIPIYTLFVSEDFMGNFQTFLGLLGIGMAAWAAIFLIDYVKIRKTTGYDPRLLTDPGYNKVNYRGVSSWLAGVLVGFLFTNSPFFDGPFATGMFQDNSLGVLLAFAVSAIVYYGLLTVTARR
jgi:NCS1 family nucleobase:cation symporter-1